MLIISNHFIDFPSQKNFILIRTYVNHCDRPVKKIGKSKSLYGTYL